MSRGSTKAKRLEDMLWMYSQRAYSDIEMAEALGVDRTTVFRDRKELERGMILKKEARGRWRIHPNQYISNIRVNLHEALALYLAARPFSPRAWGWTGSPPPLPGALRVFPTRVAVDRWGGNAGPLIQGRSPNERTWIATFSPQPPCLIKQSAPPLCSGPSWSEMHTALRRAGINPFSYLSD